MFDFHSLIHHRRSIRAYDSTKRVSEEVLARILEAGRAAPSATNRQPWKFIVVNDPAVKQKLNDCYNRPWFQDVPTVLVVVGYPDQAWVRADGYNSLEMDLTIVMDHLILAAEYEGVSTCWMININPKAVANAIGLEPGAVVHALTPLGYPPEGFVKPDGPHRKPLSEVVRMI